MSWSVSRVRRWTWQNSRSGEVSASGRSQDVASTANTIRPPNIRDSGRQASTSRSRSTSTWPTLIASYSAPCPRRCSGARHSPTSEHTGPSVHSSASVSSNSSSARRPKQPYSSPRKARSRSAAAATLWSTIPTGFRLSITATADHFRASQLEGSSGGRPPARARTTPVQLTDAEGLNDKLRETVFHDVPIRGSKHLAHAQLVPRLVVALVARRDLLLVGLTSDGLRRLGLTRGELIESDSRSYPRTAAWARPLHDHSERVDGLLWVSRQRDTSRALILFGDRVKVSELVSPPGRFRSPPPPSAAPVRRRAGRRAA